jgi:tetratricopeptide (TPR) repeat protein
MSTEEQDVLEQNVSSLLESGGEAPRISDIARARIRTQLVDKFAAKPRATSRKPAILIALGLAAAAATATVIATRHEHAATTKLSDGSTYLSEAGAKVTVLGPRRVRVEGAVLLDIAPGKGTFVVETASGRIEVLGTRFLVAADAQRTTAAVVRGVVKLASDRGDVTLHAGEQGVAEHGKVPTRGPAPRLSHLVSWAREARHRAENDLEPLHHGTLFAREPGVRWDGSMGQEYPLPIKQLTVDVVVEDQVARVALDQTFHNDTPRVLEGNYRFAIPPDAALQRLAMYVDGKLTESAVVERMRARRIYEELVYRRIDPALLEYAGSGRLNLRVYPLPPRQDKRLMVAYTQSLPKLYSDYTLTIPLPEVDQPVADMVVSARIKGCGNCDLSSPSHQVVVERSGEDAIVKYHRAAETIGDSFVVHVRDTRKQTQVATHGDGADKFLLVRAPADVTGGAQEYRPRTWVILDDVSASRSALELKAQQDLVDAFLRELDEQDKVSVVAFDVEAREKLAPTRVIDVDRRAVRAALKGEGGVGATDFSVALAAAAKALQGVNPDDAMIVYLGDGVVTTGPRNLDALRKALAGKAHFIGVGVGDGPDVATLEAFASATGGYATTMDLADDLSWRAFDLIAALHTSRVTGVSAKLVDATEQLVPATAYLSSGQLADGEEVELVAKLAGDATPVAVELAGTRDGKPWTQRIALGEAHEGGYLPRLWAQRHIAARLLAKHDPVIVPPCATDTCPTEDQVRQQRDEEIRKEVVTLGKQYFLLSRHTSLLVLENDAMYAQYGVRKGAGDTWAPYTMPAKVAVTTSIANVADDAELVRTPLQIFYTNSYASWEANDSLDDLVGIGGIGGIGTLSGAGFGQGFGRGGGGSGIRAATVARETRDMDRTRGDLGLTSGPMVPARVSAHVSGKFVFEKKKAAFDPMPRPSITSTEVLGGEVGEVSLRRQRVHAGRGRYRTPTLQSPMRLHYASEPTFDDLTALVPAFVPDDSDMWRAELTATTAADKPYPIDPAAEALLERARGALAPGLYTWNGDSIAVDAAHHFGWRRDTETGLGETAAYDGKSFTRRYAELGLSVTRPTTDDDVALAFAYAPFVILEPSHYARYFTVNSRGAHEVELATARGTAYVLTFDDKARLVAIHDRDGSTIFDGAVTFEAQPVTDIATWAHGASAAGVVVELPMHLPAYWTAQLKTATDDAAWRSMQRQRMAAAAAVQDRPLLLRAYEELRDRGGVERGDLVLASAGLASADDKALAAALAPLADEPAAKYIAAWRAYSKSPKPDRLVPATREGQLGALWSLRYVHALLAAEKPKLAADEALQTPAFTLRLIAAMLIGQRYNTEIADVTRVWESVATGPYKNLARQQLAQSLYSHGKYEDAANMVAKLVADLDVDAAPADVAALQYAVSYSRRGQAGWQLTYATWRDRVLASKSFDHLVAFLPAANQHVGDAPRVLSRALEVAGNDRDRKLLVARLAIQYNQALLAEQIIDPLLAQSPTYELYQLAASQQLAMSHPEKALELYEKAQDAGRDDEVDIGTVRSELSQIINLCRQLALQGTAANRDKYVARALQWAAQWRAIDPDNTTIDRQMADLLFAVGNTQGAWRELSSVIERDPWSGQSYATVATAFEQQGKVAEAVDLWQQAIVIDQTNPTHRMRKAQALIALGRNAEGEAILRDITQQRWHSMWSGTVAQAQAMLTRK